MAIVVLKLYPNRNKANNNTRSYKLQIYQLFPQASLTTPQITTSITLMFVKKLGDRCKRSWSAYDEVRQTQNNVLRGCPPTCEEKHSPSDLQSA